MKSIPHYMCAALYRLRRRNELELVHELENRQWWALPDLMKYCDEKTAALAQHAAAKVPYYRDLFQGLGVDAETISLPKDWGRIPILDKDALRIHHDRLTAGEEFASRALPNASGGSTGKPVKFFNDGAQLTGMFAAMHLWFSWAGWEPGEMCMHLWGGKPGPSFQNYWKRMRARLAGQLIFPVYSYDEKAFASWWQIIQEYRPTILYAYPSVASAFSLWLESEGLSPTGFKGIFSSAEVLQPAQRGIIERVFGCRVYNQYGSRETPGLACECPHGGMHVLIDLARLEFVQLPGDPPGQNRIIVTPLENYAQPLLRYDLGDMGNDIPTACPCGRGYPLMQLESGRRNDHFVAIDGRHIYPSFFVHLMDGIDWVRQYQFRQTAPTQLSLLLETLNKQPVDGKVADLRRALLPHIHAQMGHDVSLDIDVVPLIERTAAGKHRHIINDLGARK